jgi:hypothetical protein
VLDNFEIVCKFGDFDIDNDVNDKKMEMSISYFEKNNLYETVEEKEDILSF